jgi:hypothetical protein
MVLDLQIVTACHYTQLILKHEFWLKIYRNSNPDLQNCLVVVHIIIWLFCDDLSSARRRSILNKMIGYEWEI